MKKILLFVVMALAMLLPARADNYFTTGVNDTVRVNPIFLSNGYNLCVRSYFEARLDNISLTLTYPTGITVMSLIDGSDMNIPFVNCWGHDTIYNAHFTTNSDFSSISCVITEPGYMYVSGIGWVSYGSVKWEAGVHDNMFNLMLVFNSTFRSGNITINGVLSSTHDWRGVSLVGGALVSRQVHIYVGYLRGDVTGDEHVNISDITLLTSCVQNDLELDEFQTAAADMNNDGVLNITDITLLTSYVNGL